MKNYAFESERLRLSAGTLDDTDTFHALWTDAGVRRYLWDDRVIRREVAEEVIYESVQTFADAGYGQWLVSLKEDGAVIGFCGLKSNPCAPQDIELLYGLYPAFWGKGYAVEASREILDHAFNALGLAYLVAEMDTPNAASARVAEKLGMRFEKEYTRNNLPTLRYVLDAAAWRDRK